MNLAQYVAIPKKLLTPLAVVGGAALYIASTFFGSGEMPWSENTNPKNEIEGLLNSHFFLCKVRSDIQLQVSASSCSACVCPKTMTSSLIFSEPKIFASKD